MPHTARAICGSCVQQEPAEDLCGGYPQEGRGHARLSLRRGARWQRKVEARAAEGAEIGHKQRRGMLRLQKYTAGGRKFGVLAVLGESANPTP